jgi:predicted transcriptional regulator
MNMRQTTVRIDGETHEVLKRIASADGLPLHSVLAEAVEGLRRRRFLEAVNRGYEAASRSPGWEEMVAERAEWDYTLADGLGEAPQSGSRKPKRGTGKRRHRR